MAKVSDYCRPFSFLGVSFTAHPHLSCVAHCSDGLSLDYCQDTSDSRPAFFSFDDTSDPPESRIYFCHFPSFISGTFFLLPHSVSFSFMLKSFVQRKQSFLCWIIFALPSHHNFFNYLKLYLSLLIHVTHYLDSSMPLVYFSLHTNFALILVTHAFYILQCCFIYYSVSDIIIVP